MVMVSVHVWVRVILGLGKVKDCSYAYGNGYG